MRRDPRDFNTTSSRDSPSDVGSNTKGNPRDVIGDTPGGITRNVIGATPSGIAGDDVDANPSGVTPPTTKEQIEGHLSALRSLVKEHNNRGNISPIHLNFDDVEDRARVRTVVTGKEVVDADLNKSFKEEVKTPLTLRIIEFVGPEFKMSVNVKLYDGTTDPKDHLKAQEDGFKTSQPEASTDGLNSDNNSQPGFIVGVSEVMKISSFINAHRCPELAKRYSDKVPKTIDEMMVRLDDFVRSEEAFASTELPKGENNSVPGPTSRREDRFHKEGYGVDRRRNDGRNTFNNRDGLALYRPHIRFRATAKPTATKADETVGNGLGIGEAQLPGQDVRQMGRGNVKGRDVVKDKVINMIWSWPEDRKIKSIERDESTHCVSTRVVGKCFGSLIIEADKEGYLVLRVYVDQGASVEVMFKHCLENLSPTMKSRLRSKQMDLVGFAGGVVKPLGKIKLEVVFGDGGCLEG
ncbi:hypothetical protein Tco_1099617 [Tanacetum coccineum]